jgi:peptidoglycan/LPS O-acetylase OafA/YrhL
MKRLPGVEGARAVAAMSVVAFHIWLFDNSGHRVTSLLGFGWLGVTLFFVLSGLLLYRPFAHAVIHGTPFPSWRRYARARFLRIFPAWWLVLLAFAPIYGPHSFGSLAANVGLVHLWFAGGIGTPIFGGLTQSWTLCIEVSFYVFLPALVIVIARFVRRLETQGLRAVGLAVPLLMLIPIGIQYRSMAWPHSSLPVALPGYIDQFALGMLLAVAIESPLASRVRASLFTLAAVPVFALAWLLEERSALAVPEQPVALFAPIMALVFALLLGGVILSEGRGPIGKFLEWRPVTWLGMISYGIYLWHAPIVRWLSGSRGWTTGGWTLYLARLTFVLGLTLGAASISWYLLERRLLKLKDQTRHNRTAVTPAPPGKSRPSPPSHVA